MRVDLLDKDDEDCKGLKQMQPIAGNVDLNFWSALGETPARHRE